VRSDTVILSALTLATTAVAIAMAWAGFASWLEAVSFITGAVCVWLTVRENVWNFPIGMLNVATFVFVFARVHLYGDAGLQVVYFVLGIIGWYLWLYGGERHTRLKVSRVGRGELLVVVVSAIALTLLLWSTLRYLGGSASPWDALTTALSLGSQWLLNRKHLEAWIGWIIVDVIYVPLYIYKSLYLTAILYMVFLLMAFMGLRAWQRTWRANASGAIA
jgi:nicotinamide mononucleotide transporter